MSIKDKLDRNKQHKKILEELDFYKHFISKKIKDEDFKSALDKIASAIILIKDNQENYGLTDELIDFVELKQEIINQLEEFQNFYFRRYRNLLKENLTESNIERFLKLLAMLKDEVDVHLDRLLLQDLSVKISRYFTFLKKLYTIISSYRILNYHGASQKIFEFVREIKNEDCPNIKALIFVIYQNLLNNQFSMFSNHYKKLSITELSQKLGLNRDSLTNLLSIIIKDPSCPIKKYNSFTQEVIFNM